jgi:hypothetical protein
VGPAQATARQIARARELLTVLGVDSDGPHGFAARAAAGEVTHEEAGMFILALDAERQRRGLADPGEPAH